MRYDAVIIGAGPSGLAAAGRLCHFGVSVCLLEAHRRVGGLSSWHHVAGREISSGLHAFTNYREDGKGMLGKLLRQLRIKPGDLALKPQGRSAVRFPSATLFFSNDPEYIRQQAAAVFPGEIDGFDRFRALVRETDESAAGLPQHSAREVLARFIRDPLLADMLLCPVMFYGNPGGVGDGRDASRVLRHAAPDMDWLLFCVVWKCIFETGFAFPAAGMRPLWEALVARIREGGGDIRMGARVASLRREGGRVVAAVLESGEEIAGEAFFSSAGGVETDGLLGGGDVSALPVGKVSIAEGIAVLDAPPAAAGLEETTVFYSTTDAFAFGRPEGLVETRNGVLCAPGNYLPFDPDGENILKVTQLAGYPAWRVLADFSAEEYALGKRSVADGMAGVVRGFGVDFAALRSRGGEGRFGWFDDVFTPLTLERYTSHAEGALYGSPVKARSGATSCENLFLIGADQGFHGIVGAMLSGVAMVNLHWLAKRG